MRSCRWSIEFSRKEAKGISIAHISGARLVQRIDRPCVLHAFRYELGIYASVASAKRRIHQNRIKACP